MRPCARGHSRNGEPEKSLSRPRNRAEYRITKAIIIGGGIGGLSAAAALARVGIDCEVFEQAEELREVGAGLTLWANAIRALKELGVAEAVLRLGSRIESVDVRTSTGRILAVSNFLQLEEKLRVPVTVVAHRADLLQQLARLTDPSRLHCRSRCLRWWESTEGVTACFADGKEVCADLLVGADGLHSTVRRGLYSEAKPRYAGYTCWRGIADIQPKTLENSGFEAWGRGARFAVYPCGPNRVFWYGTRNVREGQGDSPHGRKADVQEVFRRWHSPIPEIIEATRETEILRNDIVDRPPTRRWGSGRVTLLGDAAHPTTPNLGQGACQAIEDALVLADCLRGSADVQIALRAYEQRRYHRTAAITNQSWRLGRLCQWEQSFACWARNLLTRCVPSVISMRLLESPLAHELPALPVSRSQNRS